MQLIAKRLALDNADATGYSPSKPRGWTRALPLGAAIPHTHASIVHGTVHDGVFVLPLFPQPNTQNAVHGWKPE